MLSVALIDVPKNFSTPVSEYIFTKVADLNADNQKQSFEDVL